MPNLSRGEVEWGNSQTRSLNSIAVSLDRAAASLDRIADAFDVIAQSLSARGEDGESAPGTPV